MHDIQVGRSPGGLGPVDHSGDSIALPQDVAGMEVAMYQPMPGRRRALIEDVDRASPESGSRCPTRHRKIIWSPELVRSRPKIIINRRAVDDHSDLRELIDRVKTQWSKPNAAGEPGSEIRIVPSLAAIRVGGNESRHRKAGTLHQPAAQGLTYDVLAADLTPALDGNMTQDDRFAITEMDR